MTLLGVTKKLTAREVADEPRSLGVVAYFDGYIFGAYGNPARNQDFPRRLTRSEEIDWREGFNEGRTERVCHSWHGFNPCPGGHPASLNPDDWWRS